MSDSVWPHRRQPTRPCRPWDSPGKTTAVGCHCILWHSSHMLVKKCSKFSKPGFSNTWHELPDAQAGFRKGRRIRDQIANIHWTIKKAREFQKNIYFCFIDYAKAFDCVDHNKLWKILKEMGIPDQLICLFRNLYAGQEATVRTGHGTNQERSTSRLYIVTLLI